MTVDALERLAVSLGWDPWRLFSQDPLPISHPLWALLIKRLARRSRTPICS